MSFEFKGKWICTPDFLVPPINVYRKEWAPVSEEVKNHREDLHYVHALFNKKFTLEKGFKKAVMDITADDYYKLYINGTFVAQGPVTGYHFNYYRNRLDITPYLNEGENDITVSVLYSGYIARSFVSGDMRMGMVCDLDIDGKTVVVSDESWKYAEDKRYIHNHTVGYLTQMLEDWDANGVCDEYLPVSVKEDIDYTFSPEPVPVIPVYRKDPVKTEILPDGGIFVDFGEQAAGTVSFDAIGKKGQTVRVLCGEQLCDEPQRVRYKMLCNCLYEQNFILSDGKCTFNEYDYKCFRYMTLYPESGVEVSDIHLKARHWAFDDEYCTLRTNDEILREVFNLCKHGVKIGTQEVYVDCPQREKGQYAGDLTITSASQLWLTGDIFMFRKAIDAQMQSARICPGLMAVMPSGLSQEIADYSLQFPILALRYYAATGDREYLKKCLECCENLLSHFEQFARPDGLLESVTDKWNLVDWPDSLRDGYAFKLKNPPLPGFHNVINAFYVGAVKGTEQIKDILGIPHENKAQQLTDTFNKLFFDYDAGLYRDVPDNSHSAIHSNIYALYYGLEPEGYGEAIAQHIADRMKNGIICGVYVSYFMLKALCKHKKYEEVYKIITATCTNSWYNMIREGATACQEAWSYTQKSNISLCHPWASSPISITIEDLLGYSFDGTRGEVHLPEGVEAEIIFKK